MSLEDDFMADVRLGFCTTKLSFYEDILSKSEDYDDPYEIDHNGII